MSIDKVLGTQLYIKVGNGLTPETFTHPCLINTKRGIKFGSNSNKIIMPDCDNPDDPAWTQVITDGLNAMVDGAGKLDAAAIPDYDAWFRGGTAKNIQVWLGTKGYWQGAFKLTAWEINGDRNDYCDASVTIESDGEVATWVPQGA
jgi:predicted secreted protein